ncbi:copper amine oxidase N-terminal domain-containing protein [Paenibacillus filicis]|uniref:Copper amine oxidase N-terminal domain-containing protein n=1 Tax=Paenibacillus filicis TaxID=669464 RepID=A0ABU9DF44_9BACL
MKKMSALLLSLLFITPPFSSVQAEEKPLSVWLNGEQIQFGQSEPFIENGATLVPIHPLLEKLGVEVSWDEATGTVSGAKEAHSFFLHIGNTSAMANDQAVKLEAAPKFIQQVTYVPLRFVAEAVGYQVAWDPSLRQVTLTSGQVWL